MTIENKRVLILGGSGMLGHKLYQVISKKYSTFVTFRNYSEKIQNTNIFKNEEVINNVDAFQFDSIINAIEIVKPNVIVNCIGIIKQLDEAKNSKKSIYINSLFPHLLAEECEKNRTKLVHISTDCVFSGKRGNYNETDFADASDLYGRTKYLGEINYGDSLTIRTSIIGHELFSSVSLVDWFLSNKGNEVNGFERAIYTGLPTIRLSKEILRIIQNYPELNGLYQICTNPISKYDLLKIINTTYNLSIKINKDVNYSSDKSLRCDKYQKETNYFPKDWETLVEEMYNDFIANKKIYGKINV